MLAETGDPSAVAVLADASLALARGEAMQRRQRHDPDTTIDAYLDRCALKTGKLFEAACLLGGGSGEYGLLLGIAFQIADDVLDCAGDTIETGKVPGTDLRDGTPTLPLLLAAREDPVVREALAGGPNEGALVRVAATGALERSRELALDYASEAEACLDGAPRRDELEALDAGRRGEEKLIAVLAQQTLEPIREKIEAGERLDFEDGVAILESDDLLALGELADLARRRARRNGRGLLRPEPLREPDERLPREVQVLRVRGDAEAGARVHDHRRGARRGRAPPARGDRVHRDPHGQRREPARRLRLLPRHDRARSTTRCPTCTSSATRRPRSTT